MSIRGPTGDERISPLPPGFRLTEPCEVLKIPHRRLLSAMAELALMRTCGELPPRIERKAPPRRLKGPEATAPFANTLVNDPSADTIPDQTTQSETTIVKDPVTGNLIVGWNDSGDFTGTGGDSFTGWGVSTDGGATFTDLGPFLALTAADWSLGDPSLAVHHATGRVYFSTLACDSALCNLEKLDVARSRDGGLTWPQRVNPVSPPRP